MRFAGKGSIRGFLYDLGEYPGAVASDNPADRIFGELFELVDEAGLGFLDELEW